MEKSVRTRAGSETASRWSGELDAADVQACVASALALAERRRRSGLSNTLHTLIAGALVAASFLLGAEPLFIRTEKKAALVVGAGWALFEGACAAYHLKGDTSVHYRIASAIDGLAQPATLLALIYLTGGFSPGLVFLVVAQSFAWLAEDEARSRRDTSLRAVAHGVVAAAFLGRNQVVEAITTILLFVATAVVHAVTTKTLMHGLRVSAERDLLQRLWGKRQVTRDRERIARELHDGIGADVMALALRFRRSAPTDPAHASAQRRAQRILGHVRNVVWTLRNEQTTLEDLRSIMDTRCQKLGRAAEIVTSVAHGEAGTPIAPEEALAALDAVHDVVESASDGVRRIAFELSARDALQVSVRLDDETPRDLELPSSPRHGVRAASDDAKTC